ncbi:hypothetical protein [Streptomyces sp. MP131-18]|uniref:hypothetical protein n=1 Tax=Streptomyces sp. MP131-18 TaxID=1857892 RepID=UPI0009D5B146|nr:hypothetical protein [Streptomyces sp. MP131-18]ONK13738.1 hypothetical protein STBA_45110 [Streptomyces sp. MP131-18]
MRRGAVLTAAALVVATALTLTGAADADAAPAPDACVPAITVDTEAGAGDLLALIDGLRTAGASPAAVDAALAERACLTRGDDPGLPPAEDVAVAAPDVYSIGVVNGRERWVAITTWEWQALPGAPMTGNQAVTTWFDAPVSPVLQVVHYQGATAEFPNTSREDAAAVGPHGVGFLLPPEKSATDMNVATGRSALVFEGTGTCTDLSAHGAFAHAWNDTGVTGLTIDAAGVTFDWSHTADRALARSEPAEVPDVC